MSGSARPARGGGTLLRTLIVTGDHGLAERLSSGVQEAAAGRASVAHARTLAEAGPLLEAGATDVVFLDLDLPHPGGLAALELARSADPEVPIVVLAGPAEEREAARALGRGAQDYLLKLRPDPDLLGRIVRRAAVRQRLDEDLRALLVVDELTGLYNRRGFATIGLHLLKVVSRERRPAVLVRLDVTGFPPDRAAGREGDRRLAAAAQLLRGTFRDSDVIGRLGGPEFAVLLAGDRAAGEAALGRLERALAAYARATGGTCPVSLVTGVATFDPELPLALDDLLELAERRLLESEAPARPESQPGAGS